MKNEIRADKTLVNVIINYLVNFFNTLDVIGVY